MKNPWGTILVTLPLIVILGLSLHFLPDFDTPLPLPQQDRSVPKEEPQEQAQKPKKHSQKPDEKPQEKAKDSSKNSELSRRFAEGVMMLHAKQYDYALTAFHWVLTQSPNLPEAHVNMGYTLIGLERFGAALDFFKRAIDLRPTQFNAYYGLALALEALQDLEGARGAMRTYIHLAPQSDKFLAKARAALWEWEPQPGESITEKKNSGEVKIEEKN